LRALARPPSAALWSEVRHDPGCVLLLLRQSAAIQAASALSFFPALVRAPEVLDGAVRFLDQHAERFEAGGPRPAPRPAGFVDWNDPAVAAIYNASLTYAHLARRLADQTGRCDPDNAWVAGLLAPLGWLAVTAVAPEQAAACLTDPDFPRHADLTQERLWGQGHAAVARRLARHWQLPRWVAVVPGYLGLPVEAAKDLGADPDLFRIVQLAVCLAQDDDREQASAKGISLHLPVGAATAELAASLELSPEEVAACRSARAEVVRPAGPWESPHSVPLLRDLLYLAADNRRLANPVTHERLERDVDALHQALHRQIAGEAERLLAQKLSALAEFAAGAGHEINNPLAVISGQAQYLLGHLRAETRLPPREPGQEGDPAPPSAAWDRALQAIISQTRRIHQLLADLMQFARPPRPQKRTVDVGTLLREAAVSLQDLAAQRQVRLSVAELTGPLVLEVDYQQVSTALTCLLRNAIEAAPADGWAQVHLETPAPDLVDLVIEDNGSGPPPAQREHLFDPFYSGRSAGRGRGLGLATAWRLARENGGDVRFDSPPGGPTRFILRLPLIRDQVIRDQESCNPGLDQAPETRDREPPPGTNGVPHAPPTATPDPRPLMPNV
jgi:signal transduction histidine kinase